MVILEEIDKSFNKKRGNLSKKLNDLAIRTGYNIIQINGQRVYAPAPSKNIPTPPKGCEIFIGKLSKYIYEDELIPLFEKIGPLFKFRMMLDFTEKTRGYAFATYFIPEHAEQAVIILNNYEIRPRLFIGVYKSVDNTRLFIGNIPVDKTRDEVLYELKLFAPGINDVILFHDYHNPSFNRGFVFVEFENHRFAAMARRQFTPNNLVIWDKTLYVDWADPVPVVDPKIMEKVTILYLSKLPAEYNSDDIRACICRKVSSQMITKIYKHCTYAFVHFNNRSSAEYAFSKLQYLKIKNCKVEVEWARPRRYCKKYRWVNPPENFCTSVPPSLRRLVYHHKNAKLLGSYSSTDSDSKRTLFSSEFTDTNQHQYTASSSNQSNTMILMTETTTDNSYTDLEYTHFNSRQFFHF